MMQMATSRHHQSNTAVYEDRALHCPSRHWNTWNPESDAPKGRPGGIEQRTPIILTPGDVGGLRTGQNGAQVLAVGIKDPDTARASTVHVAFDIDLHAIGVAREVAVHLTEDPVTGQGEQAGGLDVKSADMALTAIVNIENALV